MTTFLPALAQHPLFAEGLSMKPDVDFTLLGFGVTSSMIVAFVAAGLIILGVQIAMRNPQQIPSGAQNFVEWIVEMLSDLLEKILGRELMEKGFWYFATVFIFILSCNIISLFPGVGTFGSGPQMSWLGMNSFLGIPIIEIKNSFLRGANADVNMTAAMTAVFFVMSFYWAFTVLGPYKFFAHVFGSKVKFPYLIANIAIAILFFLLGIVEMFSIIVIRPLTFTFRLFGNIYGGEYMLDYIYKLAPNFAFVLLTPFYFYELLVALIQAFVFFALTAVFTRLMCVSDHDESHDHPTEESSAH